MPDNRKPTSWTKQYNVSNEAYFQYLNDLNNATTTGPCTKYLLQEEPASWKAVLLQESFIYILEPRQRKAIVINGLASVRPSKAQSRITEAVAKTLCEASCSADLALFKQFSSEGDSPSTKALRALCLGAAHAGDQLDGEFFSWLSDNKEALSSMRRSGRYLNDALVSGKYKKTRFIPPRIWDKNGSTGWSRVVFDASSDFGIELLSSFLDTQKETIVTNKLCFFERFEESLGFTTTSIGDFTPGTFGIQLRWALSFHDRTPFLSMLRRFYLFVIDLLPKDQATFSFESGLPPIALTYHNIPSKWLEGYRVIKHSPIDPVPVADKWLVYPSATDSMKAATRIDRPQCLDFTNEYKSLTNALKHWFWVSGVSVLEMKRTLSAVKSISAIEPEATNDEYHSAEATPLITTRAISSFLASYKQTNNGFSTLKRKGALKAFFHYAEGKGFLRIEPACYLLLKANIEELSMKQEEGPIAEKKDLIVLAKELSTRANSTLTDELAYTVFIALALTSLRFAEILSLKLDDLRESEATRVTSVKVRRKASGWNETWVEVPRQVYRLLESSIRSTASLRLDTSPDIACYIFLTDGVAGKTRRLGPNIIVSKLRHACDDMGIQAITPSSIRKRYMSTVKDEGLKNQISRFLLRPLTGHASTKSDLSYFTREISAQTLAYLEGAFLLELEPRPLRGTVESDSDAAVEATAQSLVHGGICRRGECEIQGTLPCFMCPGFATAPMYMSEMLDVIKAIDDKILMSPPHDKEHLIEAKKIALVYLGKMIDLKKESGQ